MFVKGRLLISTLI